jgi:hypothetical protein
VYSSHHVGHHLSESLLFGGFLGFVSALGGDVVDRSVGFLGDTLDERCGSLVSQLFSELVLDEDSGVLDGGSSGHLSLMHGGFLRFARCHGFLGDLVGDLTANSDELLEGVSLLGVSSLMNSDGGGSSSGTSGVSDDMLSSLLAEFLGEVGLHLLHSLLDSNTGGLSGLFLGVLSSLLSFFVSRLLQGFSGGFLGKLPHLSDNLSDGFGLGFLGLFGGFDDGLSGGDTVRELHFLDSNHLATLGNEDSFLGTERSAVGTGDLGFNLLKKSGREFSSRVSQDSFHGVNRGFECSVGLGSLLLKGKFVASDSDSSPLSVLPGLAAHSEDRSESALVVS